MNRFIVIVLLFVFTSCYTQHILEIDSADLSEKPNFLDKSKSSFSEEMLSKHPLLNKFINSIAKSDDEYIILINSNDCLIRVSEEELIIENNEWENITRKKVDSLNYYNGMNITKLHQSINSLNGKNMLYVLKEYSSPPISIRYNFSIKSSNTQFIIRNYNKFSFENYNPKFNNLFDFESLEYLFNFTIQNCYSL